MPFAEPSYMQGFKSPYFDEPLGGGLRGLEGSLSLVCFLQLSPRSHVKLRLAARKFFSGEAREEALECEVKSTPPSKERTALRTALSEWDGGPPHRAVRESQEMRKRMGDLGLIAMVQGPGEHLMPGIEGTSS